MNFLKTKKYRVINILINIYFIFYIFIFKIIKINDTVFIIIKLKIL